MLTRDCRTISDLLQGPQNTHHSYYWQCLWISRVWDGVEEFNDTQCRFNFSFHSQATRCTICLLFQGERGAWVALLTTGLTAREWGNEGLSEEGVHSTTQIWMNIFVFKIFMSFLLLNLQHSHQIPPLKSTVKTLNPSIYLLSPYCCSYKLSIFHESWVVLSSCPMTPQYVFQGWWMRNWEAMALNILYGNTAHPPFRPHTQHLLCPPPFPDQ